MTVRTRWLTNGEGGHAAASAARCSCARMHQRSALPSINSAEVMRELAVMGYSNKHGARARRHASNMQLSFLFDCDDVALPALKLDPDTELARVVPADVEVR
jgi:hypothetical protein